MDNNHELNHYNIGSLIEKGPGVILIMSISAIFIGATLNPFDWRLNVVWEVAALLSTVVTIIVLYVDSMLYGSKRLAAAISIESQYLLGFANALLIVIGIISLLFASSPQLFIDFLKKLPWLYNHRMEWHASSVLSGAFVAMLIGFYTSRLTLSSKLHPDAKAELEPLLSAERRHAHLSLLFVDIPICIAFFTILCVVWRAKNFNNLPMQVTEKIIALEHFLSGGIALSLIAANCAYIISKAFAMKYDRSRN